MKKVNQRVRDTLWAFRRTLLGVCSTVKGPNEMDVVQHNNSSNKFGHGEKKIAKTIYSTVIMIPFPSFNRWLYVGK